jgi:hypothetical protein
MCFFAQNYGSKTTRLGGLTTIGIPFRNNTRFDEEFQMKKIQFPSSFI